VSAADLGRLGRTVVRLRPAQFGQRARLRVQRAALDRGLPLSSRLLAGPDPASGPGWPDGFLPLDARLGDRPGGAALRAGDVRLLGVTRAVAPPAPDGSPRWAKADLTAADAPLLWRFHLYYWDWAWALDDRDRFTEVFSSWQAEVARGRGPAWHPYPASLRAWSWCGLYRHVARGSQVEAAFRGELAALAGFLLPLPPGLHLLVAVLAGAVGGAIIGGALGAASDATRAQQAKQVQQRYDQRYNAQNAQVEEQASNYRRAMTACLEGRGYTVK